MKKYISFILFATSAILTFTGCDDETATIGSSIVPDKDIVSTSTKTFYATGKSLDIENRILNNSDILYLGRYTEPDNNTTFEASFLTQFASGEGNTFPDGGVIDNSALYTKLRLYYSNCFGDKDNAMRCEVYELDKVLQEDADYFTDIDVTEYYDESQAPIATKTYSANDYSTDTSDEAYVANVEITLPNEIGNRLIQGYYSNPADYANSEVFINNIFKGVYVKCTQGDGTLLDIYRVRLEVAFQHYITSSSGLKDSIETLIAPFYSGKEILQMNKFDNGDISGLVADDDCTYLRTPAGIFTEVTLPVEEIMEACAGDTINSVKIEFGYFKSGKEFDSIPPTLLMLRKQEMESFFEKNSVCDNQTSYYTTNTNTTGRYSFSNVANLIKNCYNDYQAGNKSDDWNKVVLIPIEATADSYGNIVKISHYTGFCNLRLYGGANHPIPIEVVSSRYNN